MRSKVDCVVEHWCVAGAFKLSHGLGAETFPFVAVLLPRGNEVAVLARQTGPVQPDALIAKLVVIMEAHSNLVHQNIARRQQDRCVLDTASGVVLMWRSDSRLLREQQDMEYQQALQRDREMVE